MEAHLHAGNKSPATIKVYMAGIARLLEFLQANGMPTTIDGIAREHVEAFIGDLLSTRTPATASNRYRALQGFFKWCVEEGEITQSPMRNMKPSIVPEVPVPVLNTARGWKRKS